MDMYAEAFVANQVDGQKLLSPDIFTEQFVLESLGVSNKLHAKNFSRLQMLSVSASIFLDPYSFV